MDGRVPARLVHDEVQVVLGREVDDAVAAPPELDRLTLHGASHHRVELIGDPIGDRDRIAVEGLADGPLGQHRQRVARVQRETDTCARVQGRFAPSTQAAVRDVVVDQEGVVEHLDRDGRKHHLGLVTAERDRGGQADRRADVLGRPSGIVADQVVQPAVGLAVGDARHQHGVDPLPVGPEHVFDVDPDAWIERGHRPGSVR